jgi:hypothetical protein
LGARVCFHGFCVPADNLRSSDNYIGDDGAAALCTTLERNTTLQSLDLSGECMRVKRLVFAESCLIGCKQYESMYYKRLCILYTLEKAVTRNCHYDGFTCVSAGPPRPSHNCVLIVLCISRLTIFDRQITFASGNLWRALPPSSIAIARFRPYFVFFHSSLPFCMLLTPPHSATLQICSDFAHAFIAAALAGSDAARSRRLSYF